MTMRRSDLFRVANAAPVLAALAAASCTTIISFPEYQQPGGGGGATTGPAGGSGGATTSTSHGGSGGTATTTTTSAGGAGGTTIITGADGAGGTTITTGTGGAGGTTIITGTGGAGGTTITGSGGAGGTTITTGAGGAGGSGGGPLCGVGGAYQTATNGPLGTCHWARAIGERVPDVPFGTYQSATRIADWGNGSEFAVVGQYSNSIDFGQADGFVSDYGIFVARLDSTTGTLGADGWVRGLSGSTAEVPAMAARPTGVVIAGSFHDNKGAAATLQLDKTLTTSGRAIFVAKLDPKGVVVWSKQFEITAVDGFGPTGSAVRLAIDPWTDDIYVGGTFHGSSQLGTGVDHATAATPADPNLSGPPGDVFLLRLDLNGNVLWGKTWGDASAQTLESLTVDSAGDVFMVGEYAGTLDFGGGKSITTTPGTNLDHGQGWIARVNQNGQVPWVKGIGDGTNRCSAQGVALDNDGSPIVVGDFAGSITWAAKTVTASGPRSTFVLKSSMDASETAIGSFGGADKAADAFIVPQPAPNNASKGAIVLTRLLGTTDLENPPLASAGGWDALAVELALQGNAYLPTWHARYGDRFQQMPSGLALSGGNLLLYGTFFGEIGLGCGPVVATHFDPCQEQAANPNMGATDVFLGAISF
jgi:hypothetical protein